MMEENILPSSKVPDLIKFYEESSIEFYNTYLMLEQCYRWNLDYSDSSYVIFTPQGRIDEYGTFVAVIHFPNIVQLIVQTVNTDLEEVLKLTQKCLVINMEKYGSVLIAQIDKRFWPKIKDLTPHANLVNVPPFFICHYKDKEKAKLLNVSCPEEVYKAPVKVEHAALINSLWVHRFDGSVNLIKLVIERNGGVGIFLKESDELVSWVLWGNYNGPGTLQTVESHKRKNYGQLAVATLSKEIAEKGLHPLLFIYENNTPSLNLFSKLGFQRVKEVFWYEFKKI